MLIQFSDHLKAQEFGQCATKQSYTNQEKDQYSKFNRTAQVLCKSCGI